MASNIDLQAYLLDAIKEVEEKIKKNDKAINENTNNLLKYHLQGKKFSRSLSSNY